MSERRVRTPSDQGDTLVRELEAAPGIEPGYRALQAQSYGAADQGLSGGSEGRVPQAYHLDDRVSPRHLADRRQLPLWAQFAAVLAFLLLALALISGSALAFAADGGCQDGRGSSLDSGTCTGIGGGL